MADEEKLSTWASLIPEVYFDVIARIPAGGALVAGVAGYYTPGVVAFASRVNNFVPALALLLFFILISYTAGLMLTPLSGLIAYVSRWVIWARVKKDYPDLDRLCGKFEALLRPGEGALLTSKRE